MLQRDQPRKYFIARGSRRSVIDECMNDSIMREYIFKTVRRVARLEIAAMCSDKHYSMLRKQTATDLKTFCWDVFLIEVQATAPFLFSFMLSCTITKRPKANQKVVMGMCIALLLKYRFTKMCLIQKVISLILYAGHSGKNVCAIFCLNHCT